MKLEQAQTLLLVIERAIEEAENKGSDEVYIMQRAQVLEKASREELVEAIKEAQE